MQNRIPQSRNKVLLVGHEQKTPPPLRRAIDVDIAQARDGERVQLVITTQRQLTTPDTFRIVRSGQPDEIETGWVGLARAFQSTGIADTVCYLTYIKQHLFPDSQDKWFCIVRDVAVYRCPPVGGKAEELRDELLPTAPAQAQSIPVEPVIPSIISRPTNLRDAILEKLVTK